MQSSQEQTQKALESKQPQEVVNMVPALELMRFDRHPACYAWIYKPKKIGNTIYGSRIGAVVAHLVKDELRIGWSLCNVTTKVKEKPIIINGYEVIEQDGKVLADRTVIRGDRFNQDYACEISLGRAIRGHKCNRVYTMKGNVTKQKMLQDGLPQNAIDTICQVVQRFSGNSEIKYVSIYCDKPLVSRKGIPAW